MSKINTSTAAKGFVADSKCCGYGTSGKASKGGYDCIQIPGAKVGGATEKKGDEQCGGAVGLVTSDSKAVADGKKTLCCKFVHAMNASNLQLESLTFCTLFNFQLS